MTADHRTMIECAENAEYLRTDASGVVWFRCKETGKVLNLYAFALRIPEDVELALKSVREPQVKDFEPLEPASLDA